MSDESVQKGKQSKAKRGAFCQKQIIPHVFLLYFCSHLISVQFVQLSNTPTNIIRISNIIKIFIFFFFSFFPCIHSLKDAIFYYWNAIKMLFMSLTISSSFSVSCVLKKILESRVQAPRFASHNCQQVSFFFFISFLLLYYCIMCSLSLCMHASISAESAYTSVERIYKMDGLCISLKYYYYI